MNKKGLSILEIIIATVLMAMITVGMVNLFVSSVRWGMHGRSRVAGGELGKVFVDPLHIYVRQDTWDQAGNALTIGSSTCGGTGTQNPACATVPTLNVDGTNYTVDFVVSACNTTADPDLDVRKVQETIRWTDLES